VISSWVTRQVEVFEIIIYFLKTWADIVEDNKNFLKFCTTKFMIYPVTRGAGDLLSKWFREHLIKDSLNTFIASHKNHVYSDKTRTTQDFQSS